MNDNPSNETGVVSDANAPCRSHEIETAEALSLHADSFRPHRRRLPNTRRSITHKFSVAGHEGYITVGLFEDGKPGEVFIRMAKQGSTVRGLVDTIAVLTSMALQNGVTVESLARKFRGSHFEPSGETANLKIPNVSSITDYIFAWLGMMFSNESRIEHSQGRGVTIADDS